MRCVLFTGGARSGKSMWAERYAARLGRPVVYLATAGIGDAEMGERVALHRARRPAEWGTVEAQRHPARALADIAPGAVVLLDCLTLWTSNVLLANEQTAEQELAAEVAALLDLARERDLVLIVVTNEVGMGIVPEYALGRLYRDVLGRAAQQIARSADEVYLVTAGVPVELKALVPDWARWEEGAW